MQNIEPLQDSNINIPTESNRIKDKLAMISQIKTEGYGLEQEKEYLDYKFQEFLQAVQNGEKKIHLLRIATEPSAEELANLPKWDENSEFAEWIYEARRVLVELTIPNVKEKLSNPYSVDNPSPFQLQMLQLGGEMQFEAPDELEKLDRAWHEFVDWQLAHDKETCDKFLEGKINITEKDLLQGMLDKEIGKVAMNTADRLQGRLMSSGAMQYIANRADLNKSVLPKIGADKHFNPANKQKLNSGIPAFKN